jgi:hypothetical protein
MHIAKRKGCMIPATWGVQDRVAEEMFRVSRVLWKWRETDRQSKGDC